MHKPLGRTFKSRLSLEDVATQERVREMEKEAAQTSADPLPNTMELFSPSKVRPWPRVPSAAP